MKYYKKVWLMVLLTICFLTSCTASQQENNEISIPEITQQPTIAPTIDAEIHVGNLMGIYVGKSKSQIGLGLSAEDTKEILGKPDKTKKAKKKTIWIYKELDITITFITADGFTTIQSIQGGKDADTLVTGGNITVGTSREQVISAYKTQISKNADTATDTITIDNMDYSQLIFTFKGDIVVGVCLELVK